MSSSLDACKTLHYPRLRPSGCQFGTVITLSLSGWLTQTELGWPSVFYIFGFLGVVWGWFWFRHVHDTPDQHPSIHPQEKLYIKTGVGAHRSTKDNVRG